MSNTLVRKSSRRKKPHSNIQQKIVWKKLDKERLGIGDFWSANDPNTHSSFNLHSAHPNFFGTPAHLVGRGSGDYWRPIGLIPVEAPPPRPRPQRYRHFMFGIVHKVG